MKELKHSNAIIISALLIIATIIAYEPIRHNDFVYYDDDVYVTDNQHTQSGLSWDNIKWAFCTNHAGYWHPITWLSHMADCQLFGMRPWGHHLTSLLLHIVNTLMLFAILNAMTGALWRSAFVAAIFAVHPLNVESVAWVAERKNVLNTMFWFLTIGSYWKYSLRRKAGWYLVTLFLFVIGLMSKPMIVTLPFVLLLLDYWPFERFKSLRERQAIWRLVVEKIPFFVLSVISGIITFLGQKAVGTVSAIEAVSLSNRLTNAIVSYGKYIIKGIWPTKLGVLYPLEVNILIWKVIAYLAGLIAISVVVIIYARRNKYLLVGWLWYLGTLVPVIGIVQVGAQAMADRYTYIPSIGFFIMIVWLLNELRKKSKPVKTVIEVSAVVILLILIICTQIQVGYWNNSLSLFEHTVAVTENNYLINANYGGVLIKQGDYDDANKYIDRALRINPNHINALKNKTSILLKKGKYPEAKPFFEKILRYEPNSPFALYGIGKVKLNEKNPKEAIEYFERALKFSPRVPADIYHNMGFAYYESGDYAEAVKSWEKTIELDPNAVGTLNNLAWLLSTVVNKNVRNPEKAIELSKKACELTKYEEPSMLNTLAGCYGSAGKFDLAIETANKALKLAELKKNESLIKDIQEKIKSYENKKFGEPK